MKSGSRRFLAALACLAGIFLAALPAAAAAEEGNADPTNSTAGWIFRWLNFLTVFGGIGYALWKFSPPMFRKRAERIAGGIEDAARLKREAERQLQETEARLAALPEEVSRLRAEAGQQAAAEAERIRQLAAEEQRRIQRAAEAEIAAAERATRLELKAAGARLALERAETLLRQQITATTQSALVRTFTARLAGSRN